MAQVILETEIPAQHDNKRVYYVGPDGVIADLPPGLSQKPPRYEIATDIKPKDLNRVYVHDTKYGTYCDVYPETAERYVIPVVSIGPQAIATLALITHGADL